MSREYQYNYSKDAPQMHDVVGRERKAKTMVAVLKNHIGAQLDSLRLLNVGGSAGIIDNVLAKYFLSVISIDIDQPAIERAASLYKGENLTFQQGDALDLQFPDNSFDVVVCSHIYEHVPDPQKMMDEILRVLVSGGVCYFAAGNRIMWNEPHYNLPLLSVIPRPLAHVYVRLSGKASHYHELHYTYWGLKKLVHGFKVRDATVDMISDPEKYHIDYMIRPGTIKCLISRLIVKWIAWLSPGYIWLLQKP